MNCSRFVSDRILESTQAFLLMAAYSAEEVNCDMLLGSVYEKNEKGVVNTFTYRIPKTIDLLYGISFNIPVKNFRFWATLGSDTKELISTTESFRSVSFREPLPMYMLRYYDIFLSYSIDSEDTTFVRIDGWAIETYNLFNPLLKVGILQNTLTKIEETLKRTQDEENIFETEATFSLSGITGPSLPADVIKTVSLPRPSGDSVDSKDV